MQIREPAYRAAKRQLGWSARLTGDLIDGWPVVAYQGSRLVFRAHSHRGLYFRLLVPCANCPGEAVSRTHEIRTGRDLRQALAAPPAVSPLCPECLASGPARAEMTDGTPARGFDAPRRT